jgi:hypothetical protein
MNVVYRNDVEYHYESFWRKSDDNNARDSEGNKFPWPKEGSKYWTDKDEFKNKLVSVQNYLKSKHRFNVGAFNNRDCLLCGQKNITTGTFNMNNIIWEDGLAHYIGVHNVKPSNDFVDKIYRFNPESKNAKRTIKYGSHVYNMEDKQFLKLERNQIMIMDALMRHGGYSKKYIDKKNRALYRYSEHSGLLDFNHFGLEKVIISGKTNRVDVGDEEIFLPKNIPDALDYEYLFHTHPPTPKPGGRANIGILYEFPSISDIFHFIDHFNDGQAQGSLVITPEGMYNIRKLTFDHKKIKINEDLMYESMKNIMREVQSRAIRRYGAQFTTYEFFSKIAQDREYIDLINGALNKFGIQIDFYSREKDDKGKWIIDTIYLPIYVIESG